MCAVLVPNRREDNAAIPIHEQHIDDKDIIVTPLGVLNTFNQKGLKITKVAEPEGLVVVAIAEYNGEKAIFRCTGFIENGLRLIEAHKVSIQPYIFSLVLTADM